MVIFVIAGEVFKEKYCCNNDNFKRLKFAIQSSDEQLTKIIAQRGPFPRSLTYEDNSMFLKTYSNDILLTLLSLRMPRIPLGKSILSA
ncbi:hypothetical protein HPB48_022048 [Haemaphysalis longicornis]|uniref:Uncharacterized protein n=1 Tax=Haemaphysalis longicornis TaxID=44386 RepID=A0A9J6G7P7_HAELO|nr:hypothetical protein HPB48_022048 [Haemaphysalis longicornis]